MLDCQVALAAADLLGEGPFWDTARRRLLRVDMRSRLVHAWTPATGEQEQWAFDDPPSVAISTADGGLVVAAGAQLLLVHDGARRVLRLPAGLSAEVVLNDGKCDPAGRLWVGSYSTTGAPLAALYRIDPDWPLRCHPNRADLVQRAGLERRRRSVLSRRHPDPPDHRGRLRCRFRPGRVARAVRRSQRCRRRSGRPRHRSRRRGLGGPLRCRPGSPVSIRRQRSTSIVELPVTHPTSLAFGGAELRTLYVTSSRHRLTPEQAADQPDAGAVFAIAADVAGTPVASFGYR